MTEPRLLEIQARQLEGEMLSGPEVLELDDARRGGGHMARLLEENQQMHAELLELHRIESTGAAFAQRCLVEPVVIEAPDKTPVPNLAVASPLERLRKNRPIKNPVSPRRTIAWISAAAATALVAAGTWWWYPRNDRRPAIVAVTPEDGKSQFQVERPSTDRVESPRLAENVPVEDVMERVEPGAGSGVTTVADLSGLRFTPDSEWELRPVDDHVFPASYRLRSGVAGLVLDDGTEIVFQGPAIVTVESPREVRVDEGRFRFQPVGGESDFSVATPTVWLKGRDNLAAYLDVRPAEGTLVQVERGELTARPWSSDGSEELLLAASGMDRGLFGPAWRDDATEPATAVALNDRGEFSGLIDAADRPLRISSPTVFAQVLDTSRNIIREEPKQFPGQWRGMVDGLENAVAKSAMNINGQSVRPTTPDEIMEQFHRIRQQMLSGMPGGEGGNSSSAFSGMLNINGQEQRFSSPKEFLEAQQEMFGPMFGRMMMGQMPGVDAGNGASNPGNSSTGSKGTSNQGMGQLPGNSNSMPMFSGMINNNGQSMQFSTPEEFQRAMQQLRTGR